MATPQRQRAVTVEFDFVDPLAGERRVDELCLHRLHKVKHASRSDRTVFHEVCRRFVAAWVLMAKVNATTRFMFYASARERYYFV
jgi:hypothetical protein